MCTHNSGVSFFKVCNCHAMSAGAVSLYSSCGIGWMDDLRFYVLFNSTVKPVLRGHPREGQNVAAYDR